MSALLSSPKGKIGAIAVGDSGEAVALHERIENALGEAVLRLGWCRLVLRRVLVCRDQPVPDSREPEAIEGDGHRVCGEVAGAGARAEGEAK